MRTFTEILTATIVTILIITSPILICVAAYRIDPALGAVGLVGGLFAGPFSVLHIASRIWKW